MLAMMTHLDTALAPSGEHDKQRSDDVTSSLKPAPERRATPFHPFHGYGGPFSAHNVYILREMSRRRPDYIGKRAHIETVQSYNALHLPYNGQILHSQHGRFPPVVRRHTGASVANAQTKRLSQFFVGKGVPRSFAGERSNVEEEKLARFFAGKESSDDGDVKRAHFFVGKKDHGDEKRNRMFVGKRPHMFVGKRLIEEDHSDKRARMFVGKRPHMFVGKRPDTDEDEKRARMFVGKRPHMFVGKREDEENEEKRSRMFVGKRPHMFVGKRSGEVDEKRARMFVGKRSHMFVGDEDDKRARMFVGKRSRMFVGRRSENEEDDKRSRMFVGKREDNDMEDEKRNRMFVGKRQYSIPSDFFDNLKRTRYFVGKREDGFDHDEEKRNRMFVGKRRVPGFVGKRPAPGFIGKRSVDMEDRADLIVKRSAVIQSKTDSVGGLAQKTAVKSKRDTVAVSRDNTVADDVEKFSRNHE